LFILVYQVATSDRNDTATYRRYFGSFDEPSQSRTDARAETVLHSTWTNLSSEFKQQYYNSDTAQHLFVDKVC